MRAPEPYHQPAAQRIDSRLRTLDESHPKGCVTGYEWSDASRHSPPALYFERFSYLSPVEVNTFTYTLS